MNNYDYLIDFYTDGHITHCREQIAKAKKPLIRWKLRRTYKISASEYIKLMEGYMPLYIEENKNEIEVDKKDREIISLFANNRGKKRFPMKRINELRKSREHFATLRNNARVNKQLIESKLWKYKISTSQIL